MHGMFVMRVYHKQKGIGLQSALIPGLWDRQTHSFETRPCKNKSARVKTCITSDPNRQIPERFFVLTTKPDMPGRPASLTRLERLPDRQNAMPATRFRAQTSSDEMTRCENLLPGVTTMLEKGLDRRCRTTDALKIPMRLLLTCRLLCSITCSRTHLVRGVLVPFLKLGAACVCGI